MVTLMEYFYPCDKILEGAVDFLKQYLKLEVRDGKYNLHRDFSTGEKCYFIHLVLDCYTKGKKMDVYVLVNENAPFSKNREEYTVYWYLIWLYGEYSKKLAPKMSIRSDLRWVYEHTSSYVIYPWFREEVKKRMKFKPLV